MRGGVVWGGMGQGDPNMHLSKNTTDPTHARWGNKDDAKARTHAMTTNHVERRWVDGCMREHFVMRLMLGVCVGEVKGDGEVDGGQGGGMGNDGGKSDRFEAEWL